MSQSSANASIARITGSFYASDYIANKKKKYITCCPNRKYANTSFYATNIVNTSNTINNNNYNESHLYSNLYTHLDLTNVTTITDISGNTPVYVTNGPMLPYDNTIDPSGVLFGDLPCNSSVNYLHPN